MARIITADMGISPVTAEARTELRAIIVDDDPLARGWLHWLLANRRDVAVLEKCDGGRKAVSALRNQDANLVFLDIEMPDLDGFGVIAEVGVQSMPSIIFTSAFSLYAVRAFEAYALDYLLKPFDGPRVSLAIERARNAVRHASASRPDLDPRLVGLLDHLRQPADAHPASIAIKMGDRYVITALADVDWIEASGNYARVWVNRRARLLTKTLAVLETEVLDPEVFVRVHRSAIVNTRKIASVEPNHHGDLVLLLHDGTRVPCSRRYRDQLDRKIYFST